MLIQESISDLIIYERRIDIRTHICDGTVPGEMKQANLIADPTEEDHLEFTGICHSIKV
ncbi:hypothetical protein HNV12_21595 [Methanococcoides sp. SA1]|nr:hypothetical protein [Methanococcoides sp. SA1]